MSAVLGERSKSCLAWQEPCNPLFLTYSKWRSYPQVFRPYYTSVDTLNALFGPLSDPRSETVHREAQPTVESLPLRSKSSVCVMVTGVVTQYFLFIITPSQEALVHGRDVAGSTGGQR